MSIAIPRKLIVLGDSGVYGWGDPEEGGWCERLRQVLRFKALQPPRAASATT